MKCKEIFCTRDENNCGQDKIHIDTLRLQTLYSKSCRQLLVFLLRRFNPQLQSLQYLTDLVITNYMLLSDLEMVSELEQLQVSTGSMVRWQQ